MNGYRCDGTCDGEGGGRFFANPERPAANIEYWPAPEMDESGHELARPKPVHLTLCRECADVLAARHGLIDPDAVFPVADAA